ncbi:MAG TPA: GNAT family N-acetyltransferase [Candidatus Limnocylindrales bacterium]
MTSPRTPRALEVQPLTPDRFDDLAALFGQGGDPRWCWCMFYRVRGLDWSNSTADRNRDGLRRLTNRGDPPGLIGYRDGSPVGWVSLGPRESYDRLEHSRVLARVDDTPVWSIVCFVVARTARRSGVASGLLDAAIAHARTRGARVLEAYPVDTAGARIPSASAYHGTLRMFERAGFRVVATRQFNRATPVRPIVRLNVSPEAKPSRAGTGPRVGRRAR